MTATICASNIEGGEYYDWYYAGPNARESQSRHVIEDLHPANEPWIYRQKDIRNWWAHAHHNRPGGVRSGTKTAWDPEFEADLVHRTRLPGGGQGHEPAERVRRPEVLGERASLAIRAGSATTSSSGSMPR